MPYPFTISNAQSQSAANSVSSVVSQQAGPTGLIRLRMVQASFTTAPAAPVLVSAYESVDGITLTKLLWSVHLTASAPFPLDPLVQTVTKNRYMIVQIAAAGTGIVSYLNAQFEIEGNT